MEMSGKDVIEGHKGSEDPVNYHHAPNIASDWQINGNNLTSTCMGMLHMGSSMVESSSCSSASMVDSMMWDQAMGGQNLGYCDVNVQNAMLRGNMFLPSVPGMVPPSLPHFPADSGFIERAARFSCFSGGTFGEMMNTFGIGDAMNQYPRGLAPIQGANEVLGRNALKPANMTEVSKEGNPFKNEKKSENLMRVHEEGKIGSGNESDEAEFSGRGDREELDSKKRKRGGQDTENGETNEGPEASMEVGKDNTEIKKKGDQNPSSIGKAVGKNGKQGSQGSDQPKEEYIHVRARRGQATNSHSLAERVRREKISERMKFLQDLVPGCSKVTGKAVMLDEIINYVQSLQRQVEFLSMKLATVNPRLDVNIEGFLAKDSLQGRGGMPSSLSFPPEMSMPFPPIHQSQTGLIPACLQGGSSDAFRRPINLQPTSVSGGFKEPTSQVPGVWEDGLHNVVHMGFNSSGPLNSQYLSGCPPPGHMKNEP